LRAVSRISFSSSTTKEVHMAGRQAKLLTNAMVAATIKRVRRKRYPARDTVMILLSVKAGLRAGEISKLTWPMILDAKSKIGKAIELHDIAAKKLHGRTIPINPCLKKALYRLHRKQGYPIQGHIVLSERGEAMHASSVVKWFRSVYSELSFDGCSSHSGRRSFVTRAARIIHLVGGSLKDVQQLAGHRSLQTTQAYIEGDSRIQQRLVARL
jgi:integrase